MQGVASGQKKGRGRNHVAGKERRNIEAEMSDTAGNAGSGCGSRGRDGGGRGTSFERGVELVITYEANFFTWCPGILPDERVATVSGRFALRSIVFLRN